MIDIDSQKVTTTLSIDGDMLGMAIRGKTLYYCTANKGVKMLSLTDKSVSDVISGNKTNVNYVATSGDKL